MSTTLAGSLLLATPTLRDPNFYRSVVLIVEHSEEGALGVVLDRPSLSPLEEHVPDWASSVAEPPMVFVGGPVSNEMAVCLVQDPGQPPGDWHEALPGIGIVDPGEPPDHYGGVARARIYSGYAGWSAGQLDLEMMTGSWMTVVATADHVFTETPDDLWLDVVRGLDGPHRLYANYPHDLRSN